MHHANMVRNLVAGLQNVLHQEQVPTENPTIILQPVDHVAKPMQRNHQQLATQLQQMKAITKSMNMQYSAASHNAHQDYGGYGYHGGHTSYHVRGGCGA